MSILVFYVSVNMYFHFSEIMSNSKIAELHKRMLSFVRNGQIIFWNGLYHLTFPPAMYERSIFFISLPASVSIKSFYFSFLKGM